MEEADIAEILQSTFCIPSAIALMIKEIVQFPCDSPFLSWIPYPSVLSDLLHPVDVPFSVLVGIRFLVFAL